MVVSDSETNPLVRLEYRSVDALVPYVRDPRKHSRGALLLRKSSLSCSIYAVRSWHASTRGKPCLLGFQGDHYDVSLGKRVLAVPHGAVEITMREAAALRRH